MPEGKEDLIEITAKNYFNDYFGKQNWWQLLIEYPDDTNMRISSFGERLEQQTPVITYLPSEKGIVTITLYANKINPIEKNTLMKIIK